MTDQHFTLKVDDDVPVMNLLRALAAAGYRFSNVDGFTFHIQMPDRNPKVIDLATRLRIDDETDAQIRAGVSALFRPSAPRGVT